MKTTWILGAGASIAHTHNNFPSINQFFSKGKELNITIDQNGDTKNHFHNIKKYIQTVFGKNITDPDIKIDIEEVMTYIEIENEKKSIAEINNIKQNLLDFIRKVLDELSKKLSGKESKYNEMINKLNDNDSIITFNWDLLLDNILKRELILSNKKSISTNEGGYLQYYNTIKELSARHESTLDRMGVKLPYKKYDEEKGYYLKLHGSIDWLYCSNETCRGYGKVFPMLSYNVIHYCSECHEKMKYLIIPPVLNKKYNTYPYIKKTWNKATKELQNTEKIIIWGYSLPPTDFYSQWLLRQARDSIKELIIINPEIKLEKHSLITLNKPFINKFVDLYKPNISLDSIKTYEYFNDFIENNELRNKYNLNNI